MKLKEPCWNCQGRDSTVKQSDCEHCNGKGFILTHEGEVIKEFIEEHFKAIVSTNYESGIQHSVNIEFK